MMIIIIIIVMKKIYENIFSKLIVKMLRDNNKVLKKNQQTSNMH